MTHLKNQFISVFTEYGCTYGGDQLCCSDKVLRRCGCGIIAALDVLLYLNRYHRGVHIPEFSAISELSPIPQAQYERQLAALRRSCFPLLYPLGMNGLGLAVGMEFFFKRHRLPFRSRWCVPSGELWQRMEIMLERDIPVILAVGPNFPKFWQNKRAQFCRPSPDGYKASVSTKAHFVTATGLDENWIEISSWGTKYYLCRDEFMRYSREASNPLLCNILYIENK